MPEQGRRGRAARRVRPGDGRPLPPFRWWQLLSRSLFSLSLPGADGRRTVYTVDVQPMGDENGVVRADLYLDGRQSASSRVPAAFPVDGGVIEVAATVFGLKRCHYVTPDGGERQLVPDPRSAAGRRLRIKHDHPALSRSVGSASPVQLPLWLTVAPGLGAVVASVERGLRLRYH